jgi:DNA-binding NarL/FixJ family response regulator
MSISMLPPRSPGLLMSQLGNVIMSSVPPEDTNEAGGLQGTAAEGGTNAEIAERLWVSPVTVRKHLENVYAKLGVHNARRSSGDECVPLKIAALEARLAVNALSSTP